MSIRLAGENSQMCVRQQETGRRWQMPNLLILVALSLAAVMPTRVDAATISAASCSRTDVASAITKASNGDTVLIPAGACTWTSAITVGTETSRTKMVKL